MTSTMTRTPVGRFDALPKKHFATGQPCCICKEVLKAGNNISLIASEEVSGIAHEACVWPEE